MFASQINERDFIRKFLRTRNEEMFHTIYQQHTPRLFQLALRLLHWSQPDAEDALQELWIRAMKRLPEFRWESNFHTWLTGILIHCCQEILRKRTPLGVENHLQTMPEPGTSSYDAMAL
jgi:RNA polymerase sigma-70 factor (ECF subfamily)